MLFDPTHFVFPSTHFSFGRTHLLFGPTHLSFGPTHISVGPTHLLFGPTHFYWLRPLVNLPPPTCYSAPPIFYLVPPTFFTKPPNPHPPSSPGWPERLWQFPAHRWDVVHLLRRVVDLRSVWRGRAQEDRQLHEGGGGSLPQQGLHLWVHCGTKAAHLAALGGAATRRLEVHARVSRPSFHICCMLLIL